MKQLPSIVVFILSEVLWYLTMGWVTSVFVGGIFGIEFGFSQGLALLLLVGIVSKVFFSKMPENK
ncbi:hypothetical protein SMD22_07630 [Brevibacillus halotolerans]|nr:hypothetical protein SMD22_07630 [Brevibacillus halotolerans]